VGQQWRYLRERLIAAPSRSMETTEASADNFPVVSLTRVAVSCRCPRCGKGPLFAGLLRVRPTCAICGLDLSAQDGGDGPAVFVILLLGLIAVGLAGFVEIRFSPPIWVHVLLWTPLIFGGAVGMLRPFKAGLIALQYRYHLLAAPPPT
jgi:uncharacterized protein (DUF983 family)